ncbi:MAG: CRISPR system precrRNA processing endoribonuclease RAMP protein Cas6 [Desulfobacterales bacterium]|nr:CRISPR system precrRNA processing endoribonuclease RAMP protein Cas6 [Desulfobacterales bacterium]
MIFGKYLFQCRLETEAILPWYKGSTFRGVFGHALKDVVCALKRQKCESCLLKQQCVYTRVFEPALTGEPPEGVKFGVKPPPYIIEPPLTRETNFPKGSTFDFLLILLGEINLQLPYFIYAFYKMGEIGIGRRINGRRGQFNLETVSRGDDLLYTDEDQVLRAVEEHETLSIDGFDAPRPDVGRLKVTLETPLRLKFDNRLTAELPFHVLVRAMLRRVSTLMACHGAGNPALDYGGLVKRAMTVGIADNQLDWFDWRRYSTRQEKAMIMGGMVGSVIYEGDLGEFIPLIRLCEKLHVGKQTTFGLGKIRGGFDERF